MAREAIRPEVDAAPAAWRNLTDADPGPGTVQQAAHDLRQPIAAVLALASAALADGPAPGRVQRRLEQIIAEAQWLSTIIQDMLAGPDVPPAPAVDILTLVCDVVRSEQLTCASQIILQQTDQTPRYSMAASTRLRRALANVLANATRAAGPDGCVKLTQRTDGRTEVIEIVDDGPGFGSGAAGRGAGIGLRITGQMLAECGGRMEVERLPSHQTMVRLLLPVRPDARVAGGDR
jgi:signal transduction histidine kinase